VGAVLVLVFLAIGLFPGSQPALGTPAPGAPSAAVDSSKILWDEWGVPHIYAADRQELGYGFGWAQMKSHGDAILRLYGLARGRGAEYWGKSIFRLIACFTGLTFQRREEKASRTSLPAFGSTWRRLRLG
jgi:Protein related to penicillin acylase